MKRSTLRNRFQLFGIFLIALFTFIFLTTGVNAATIDEILIMRDAGIPTEVIIEIVEATGLDDNLDEDAIIELVDADLDPDLLQYLLTWIPGDENYTDYATGGTYGSIEDHPNWAGGSGFHHGGTSYNPLNDRSDPDRYWEGPSYTDGYYRDGYNNYYYPGNMGITIYQPPVYQLYSNPYIAYPLPRYYDYTNYYHGYWDNGRYVIYDGDYIQHYDQWYRDRYRDYYDGYYNRRHGYGWSGSFGGSWHSGDGYDWWDTWGDARYHSERVNLRISF